MYVVCNTWVFSVGRRPVDWCAELNVGTVKGAWSVNDTNSQRLDEIYRTLYKLFTQNSWSCEGAEI